MNRLQRRLSDARERGRGVLLGYLPAGYPDPDAFCAVAGAAFEAGLDILEVGMPGPPPALDGPTIQAAVEQARQHVSDVPAALTLAASSRTANDQVLIALAHDSVLEACGADSFLQAVAAADVDGVLCPEQPMETQLRSAFRAREIGLEQVIFLHLKEELDVLASTSLPTPVLYLQSADLRTGGQFNGDKAAERLAELAETVDGDAYQVVVGFGLSEPEHVRRVIASGADGAVVGTSLVTAAAKGPQAVAAHISELAEVLGRAGGVAGEEPGTATGLR